MIAAKFDMMNAIAAELGEENDCAVRAVAFATSTPYTDVRNKLRKKGRGTGEPTETETFMAVVLQCGKKFNLLSDIKGDVTTVMGELKRGVYIVTTKDHVFAVINGQKADYRNGAADQVEEVYEVY